MSFDGLWDASWNGYWLGTTSAYEIRIYTDVGYELGAVVGADYYFPATGAVARGTTAGFSCYADVVGARVLELVAAGIVYEVTPAATPWSVPAATLDTQCPNVGYQLGPIVGAMYYTTVGGVISDYPPGADYYADPVGATEHYLLPGFVTYDVHPDVLVKQYG